jgi:hypothetical protein
MSSSEFEHLITQEKEKDEEMHRLEKAAPEIDIFRPVEEGETVSFDLRSEVHSQILLLKAIRAHIFYRDGRPKLDTEPSDITSYMNSSMKLLTMLQSFESSLKTDKDLRRIELAIEMAMEDCSCPEFVAKLVDYLEGDLI